MNREALACAAGFFNGEGCTTTHMGSGVRLSIEQVTRWELEQFQIAVGGIGRIHGPYRASDNPNHQMKYRYRANGWRDVQTVISLLWVWLSPSKRTQARSQLIRYHNWRRNHPQPWRFR